MTYNYIAYKYITYNYLTYNYVSYNNQLHNYLTASDSVLLQECFTTLAKMGPDALMRLMLRKP